MSTVKIPADDASAADRVLAFVFSKDTTPRVLDRGATTRAARAAEFDRAVEAIDEEE